MGFIFKDSSSSWLFLASEGAPLVSVMVIDAMEVRSRTGSIIIHHFKLNESSLHIETDDNRSAEIPYEKVEVLLPATSTVTFSKIKTMTERKLSLGKTLLTGGIPMFNKVTRQEEMTSRDSRKILYLYVIKRREPIIFSEDTVTYEGLGEAMKLSFHGAAQGVTGSCHLLE